tara:strand:+ start:20 stop:979 length:960 start_codon:yes stop_codon:yes gene_type:complete
MSNTHDYDIGNAVGATFRADLNSCLADIQSTNSGSNPPTTLVVGKLFADTSNNLLKICTNASGSGTFTSLGKIDVTDMGHATTASPSFTGTITSAGDLVMSGTGSLQLPTGTTAQRPTPATGDIRFNTTLTQFEGYNGGSWGELANGVPVGSVFTFASATVPSGFLECNGAAISRSTYATLFAIIGTTHGSGDGSSTFNLPDLRGQFVRGWANTKTNTGDDGRSFASTQSDQNKLHTHSISTATLTGGIRKISEGFNAGGSASGVFTKTQDGNNSITGSSSTSPVGGVDFDGTHTHTLGNNGGTEVRVKNTALMYVIKF